MIPIPADLDMTPEQELELLEAIPGGPYYCNAAVGRLAVERYGRMPHNFEVLERIPPVPVYVPLLTSPERGAQWKRETHRRYH